jgi:hypothetical protein
LPTYKEPKATKIHYKEKNGYIVIKKEEFKKAVYTNKKLRINCYKYEKINEKINEYMRQLKEQQAKELNNTSEW